MRRIDISLLTGSLLLLTCCSGPIVPPGQSRADNQLQAGTLRQIKHFEMARMINGEQGVIQFGMPTVLAAKVTQQPTPNAPNSWTEIWTIKRYGGSVNYELKFTQHPELGGSDMVITPLDMPAACTMIEGGEFFCRNSAVLTFVACPKQ